MSASDSLRHTTMSIEKAQRSNLTLLWLHIILIIMTSQTSLLCALVIEAQSKIACDISLLVQVHNYQTFQDIFI